MAFLQTERNYSRRMKKRNFWNMKNAAKELFVSFNFEILLNIRNHNNFYFIFFL